MKPRIDFHLGEDRLVIEATSNASGWGWPRLAGWLRGHRRASAYGSAVALAVPFRGNDLRLQLDQAIGELEALGCVPAGGELVARLGLRFAHVDVLTLSAPSAARLPGPTRNAYVQAWIRESLRLDPLAQVVRCQQLGKSRQVLVSCVRRDVFDALAELARTQGMRFTSCRPAVMSAWRVKARQAGTVVWTEGASGGARASRVQLLRVDAGQPRASWRGWLPAASPTEADESLLGALRRFQLHHGAAEGEEPQRIHWPMGLHAHA